MKKNLVLIAVLLAAMITAPLTAMDKTQRIDKPVFDKTVNKNTVTVMLSANGKSETMNEREYLIGVLAAEAQMSDSDEALKAQAVACYTYLKYIELKGSTDKFGGADISDDSSECQGYIALADRKKKWGDKFDEYEKKAENIVDEVIGQIITYDGEPILAVYHELSSGTTESAETVWEKEYPYLQSVESPGDRLSTEYGKTVILSESEFKTYCEKTDGIKLDDSPAEWMEITDVNNNGYVKKLRIGDKSLTGNEFRAILGLGSCNFTVDYNDGKFTIKSFGKGHLVGMSQYGANYMAEKGSNYREILAHYYQNTEII